MSFIDNFKRIASKMNLRREYLHGDRGKLEGLRQDLKQWNPKNVFGKTGRAAGLGAIDLSWFLFCLGKFGLTDIFLDNYLINKWEQEKRNIQTKNKDSAFESFFKELQKSHPLAASRLQLWMVYALFTTMIVGGVKIVQNNENSNGVKTELNEKKKLSINDIKIDPNLSQEEWNKQMESIWPYLYMETLLSEGFINEAYADVGDSNGYLTIGSGYMIGKANPKTDYDREIIKERKAFFKNALGRHYVNGVKISYEENKILVHKFYKLYVWPQMKKDFSVPMDAHLFIELCIGSYNRGNGIYRRAGNGIRQSVNSGDSIKTIVNHFDDLYETGNNGLFPKYGVAAHRALGNISDTDVLNSVANSVYQFFADDLWQNGELKPYENIAQDLQNFSNLTVKKNGKTYNQYAVREYMLPEEIEIITKGLLFDSTALFSKQVKELQESTAEQLNEQAEALLDAGDYAAALEKFKLALSQDPKMYILYSNLSLTYYKLGEYDKGINVVKDFICSKYFESAPASIKGYSYYNAALCYEKLGDKISGVKQKQEYYNRAKKNAELGEKVANTKYYVFNKRIENKLSKLLTLKSKASAFNDGISKLKNKQNIVIYPADKEYLA